MPSEPAPPPPEAAGQHRTAGYALGAVVLVRVVLVWLLIGSLGALLARECTRLPRDGPEPAARHGVSVVTGMCDAPAKLAAGDPAAGAGGVRCVSVHDESTDPRSVPDSLAGRDGRGRPR